jgi:hypothetical protein
MRRTPVIIFPLHHRGTRRIKIECAFDGGVISPEETVHRGNQLNCDTPPSLVMPHAGMWKSAARQRIKSLVLCFMLRNRMFKRI